MTDNTAKTHKISKRFRSYLPVVIDVETAGFNAKKDALLEIAAVIIRMHDDGTFYIHESHHCNVEPFPGANLDQASLDFTGIDPYHPFRFAKTEPEALEHILTPIHEEIKRTACSRAVLVGHNPTFDLDFIKAAVKRNRYKNTPFHNFTTFDTATLAGLAYGQTVLAKAAFAAKIAWDNDQAHSALYDAEQTAVLFCKILNRWHQYTT